MNCQKCAKDLPDHARFCLFCGSPTSDRAGDAHLSLDRFLPQEYAAQVRAADGRLHAERRVVTILFFDMVSSTAMIENLDPEDVMEIMNGAFEALTEPIHRYGGLLARLMGDGALAFFGAPVAREDDAGRACRAALDIVEEARRYAVKLEKERGISGFQVRVGINTGLVVVGEVGGGQRVEYTAMGDAVNIAARAESVARPGTILITANTRGLIGERFQTEDIGTMEVKGKTEPVHAFRLVGVNTETSAAQASMMSAPILGREREMEALQGALAAIDQRRGALVAVTGEAGVGKSRLVTEAFRSLGTGVARVEVRCPPYSRVQSYWLAREFLHALLGVDVTAPPQEATSLILDGITRSCVDERLGAPEGSITEEGARDVAASLGRLIDTTMGDESEERLRRLGGGELKGEIIHAFRTFTRALASREPLMLVCDDMQWVDPLSLDLITELVPLVDELPLVIVLVFRTGEGHVWPFHNALKERREDRYRVLELSPLSRESSMQLVRFLLNDEKVSEDDVGDVLDKSEGNPYFLEEILRSVVETGLLSTREGGRLESTELRKAGIPRTLQGAIMARIDALPVRDKLILQTVSVIGRVFQRSVLERVLQGEVSRQEINGSLKELFRRQFIVMKPRSNVPLTRRGDDRMLVDSGLWQAGAGDRLQPAQKGSAVPEQHFMFRNAPTAEVTYSSLLKSDRRELHRRVGDAIEELFPEQNEDLAPILAFHFEKGGEYEKALGYLLRSADRAMRLSAGDEAVAIYKRALALPIASPGLPDGPSPRISIVHEGMGDALYRMGNYQEASEHFETALRHTSDPPPRTRLYRKLGQVREKWGLYDEARAAFEAGLDQAPKSGMDAEVAQIRNGLGLVAYHEGDLKGALKLCGKAMKIVSKAKDDWGIAETCNNLGIIHAEIGNQKDAKEYYERCLEIWERVDDLYGLARSHNNLGLLAARSADANQAIGHFERCLELFGQLGNDHGRAHAYDNLAQLYAEDDREKALECMQQAVDILLRISGDEKNFNVEMWQSGAL